MHIVVERVSVAIGMENIVFWILPTLLVGSKDPSE